MELYIRIETTFYHTNTILNELLTLTNEQTQHTAGLVIDEVWVISWLYHKRSKWCFYC